MKSRHVEKKEVPTAGKMAFGFLAVLPTQNCLSFVDGIPGSCGKVGDQAPKH